MTHGMKQPVLVHVTLGIMRNDQVLKELICDLVDGNGMVTLALVEGNNKGISTIVGEAMALWHHHGGYMVNLHASNPHAEGPLVCEQVSRSLKTFRNKSQMQLAKTWPDEEDSEHEEEDSVHSCLGGSKAVMLHGGTYYQCEGEGMYKGTIVHKRAPELRLIRKQPAGPAAGGAAHGVDGLKGVGNGKGRGHDGHDERV
jgi:hypothetical protein